MYVPKARPESRPQKGQVGNFVVKLNVDFTVRI